MPDIKRHRTTPKPEPQQVKTEKKSATCYRFFNMPIIMKIYPTPHPIPVRVGISLFRYSVE